MVSSCLTSVYFPLSDVKFATNINYNYPRKSILSFSWVKRYKMVGLFKLNSEILNAIYIIWFACLTIACFIAERGKNALNYNVCVCKFWESIISWPSFNWHYAFTLKPLRKKILWISLLLQFAKMTDIEILNNWL